MLPATGISSRADAIGGPVLWVLVFCAGVYGGYFGAAQGVLLIGMLGIAFNDSLQRINAVKNVLAGLVNGVAAVVFIALTHVDWGVAGLIAAGLDPRRPARRPRRPPPAAVGPAPADRLRRRRRPGQAAGLAAPGDGRRLT